MLTRSWLLILAGLISLASLPATAEQQFKFHIEPIADSLYSIRPEKYWRVNSTSLVYVGKTGLLLIDGQTDGTMAEQMVKAIGRSISKLPIEYLVISHPHLDHIGGTARLKQKFPHMKIIAQTGVVDFIRNQSEKERAFEVGQWLQPLADQSREKLASSTDKSARAQLKTQVDELDAFIRDIKAVEFIQPDILFDRQLSLNFGGQTLLLSHLAPAHTPADTIVYFPKQRVLATGDLFHNLEPLFWAEATPNQWVETLDQLQKLDAQIYVGGHGDPIKDKNLLVFWRAYIAELIDKVKAAKAAGKTLKALQETTNVSSIQAFNGNNYAQRIDQQAKNIMPFDDSMDAKLDRELEGLWAKY